MTDKIILIYTQDYADQSFFNSGYAPEDMNIPLGILYLGSFIDKHGYKIKLLDTRIYSEEAFLKKLQHEIKDAILVGFSVMTPCIGNAITHSKLIKNLNSKIKIVWGGIHPTLYPEATINNEFIDFVITNEGEIGLLALVRYLLDGNLNLTDIPGLFFKQNGKIIKNKIEITPELADFIEVNYKLLEIEKYIQRMISPGQIRRQIELITSRGCPYRCSFCINVIVNRGRWRAQPVRLILKNLDNLIGEYKIQHFFIMDEDFFYDHQRTKNLLAQLSQRRITWEANCRADYINNNYIDDDLLNSLKSSGCIKLRLGLESGSQRILNILKKDITISQSINAVKKLTQYKITPSLSFMMGIPTEKIEDILSTTELIRKLYKINQKIDIIGPLIFRPYPGSELFEFCRKKGLAVPERLDEWSDFYIHNRLEDYHNGLPWFTDIKIFKKVELCLGHLRLEVKSKLSRAFFLILIRLHILTKLKFIYSEYKFYSYLKKRGYLKRILQYPSS